MKMYSISRILELLIEADGCGYKYAGFKENEAGDLAIVLTENENGYLDMNRKSENILKVELPQKERSL